MSAEGVIDEQLRDSPRLVTSRFSKMALADGAAEAWLDLGGAYNASPRWARIDAIKAAPDGAT